MKFFHLGDLHFGKLLHDVMLLEKDQPFWVERFFEKVDEYKPDAVVIAGDVYDRRDPPAEATELYDRFLTGLAQRGVTVLVTPGNHDSAVRLSFAGKLLESQKIFTAGRLTSELLHVTLTGGEQKVTFWLMPYVFPKLIGDALGRDDFRTYTEAVRALLDEQNVNTEECNVLIAHQNVLANGKKPVHSESESIIGGLGDVDYSVFDRFDYVALGHIHNAQPVGRETVRYAGCPMYYDFSEVDRIKDLTLVTVNGKDDITIESVEIPLLHRLVRVTGTVDELVKNADEVTDKKKVYIQCEVTDKVMPPRTRERLHAAYGDTLLSIIRPKDRPEAGLNDDGNPLAGTMKADSIDEQFSRYFYETYNEDLDRLQLDLLNSIIEQQDKNSGSYVSDIKLVPADETDELISFLMKEMKEDEA